MLENEEEVMAENQYRHVILSKKIQTAEVNKANLRKTAIVIYLYYVETVQNYYTYIQNIPEGIDIYIYSSNSLVCDKVQQYAEKFGKENLFVNLKENRGRDVSALLVAGKNIIQQYEYICFVHDKKANTKHLEKDTQKWIELLWENTLASKEFILNVINEFEKNSNIGLFVPPKPVGQYIFAGLRNCWAKNYKNTVDLARKLGLKSEILEVDAPLAISTVFWAKREALNKLLWYEWKYEDFVEEPMPVDGTISHAIERILSYVVEDAGYESAIVLTDEYAEKKMSEMQYNIEKAYELLNKEFGISNIKSLESFYSEKILLEKFCEQNADIYLYGAGEFGQQCFKRLKMIGCSPRGFIVTKKTLENKVEGLPVMEFDEIKDNKEIAVIVCVSWRYLDEITRVLEKNGLRNYIIYNQ